MSAGPQVDRYGVPITFNNHQSSRSGGDAGGGGSGGLQDTSENRRGSMTEMEQKERRASIKAIMTDPSLSPTERRLSIQAMMDGRRRSSCGAGAGSIPSVSPNSSDCGGSGSQARPRAGLGGRAQPSVAAHPGMHASLMSKVDFSKMTEAQVAQTKAVQKAINARMERNRPSCNHYKRNCSIIAPCCGMAFGCRICHDEFPNLPPPLLDDQKNVKTNNVAPQQPTKMGRIQRSSSMPTSVSSLPDADNTHVIDRFKIAEVICRECFTRQSSKTNNCINCHVTLGEYHCNICNLWMSVDENPYHCEECGFCRVGGRNNFKHCHDCGMCIDALLFDEHDCKVGKYMSNCPVCQEDLFSSRAASHEMPCGHAIHWHCFRELASYDSRCPVCKKTAETPERMASTWSAMGMGIALQPVPAEMAKVVDILCIDCEQQDEHRKWHFLGVQCRRCSSFNTVVERITMAGAEAANFIREHGDGAPRLPRINRSSRPGIVGGVSNRSLSTRSLLSNNNDSLHSSMDFEISQLTTSSQVGPFQDEQGNFDEDMAMSD